MTRIQNLKKKKQVHILLVFKACRRRVKAGKK